ncbi:hypothetical protein BVRB_001070 [Beta vulgaris subsp. vulgaris]|uniref:Uncharacterized protein n=1 Tax=Beta vulgaris subsp. vulgaris TaxID=3555 RepID=A0A0J8B8P8_BETVV|nr:hypothetical protein BVRB_001070 [Beta vulgaris subsp. vulgaris]
MLLDIVNHASFSLSTNNQGNSSAQDTTTRGKKNPKYMAIGSLKLL